MNGQTGGIDFTKLSMRTRKSCCSCGETFRGRDEDQTCMDCQYREERPEARDMHWTWRRAPQDRWEIAAHWPDAEPLPEPGDQVTVHRRDGSQSTETVLEVHGLHALPTGRARLTCTVR